MHSTARAPLLLVLALMLGCDRRPRTETQAPAPPAPQPLTTASAPSPPNPSTAPTSGNPDPDIQIHTGGKRVVRGEHGMVVSVERQASLAGARILEQGGTAVDAAVATAFALAVTHPSAGNLGGGGFMLVRPKGGPTVAIDFREVAPARLTQERFDAMIAAGASGPAAVGIPGSVAGLLLAHERFGRLSRERVLAPAIQLAKGGHHVGAREALTLRWAWPELSKDEAARRMFAGKANDPVQVGARLKRPHLARTLEAIAQHGRSGFYEGKVARGLLRALSSAKVTAADLQGYRAVVREPIRFDYRGLDVEVMPPPSAGGVAVTQTLVMLEALGAHQVPDASPLELHLLIEAARRAHAERRFGVMDPDRYAEGELAQRVARWKNPHSQLDRVPIDRERATPSAKVHPLYDAAVRELEHTTHLSVADAEGGVVSLTTTLSASFGARIVAPGTGVVLNNAVASFGTAGENLPDGGKRTISSMAPTLVLRAGKPVLVLGSPGGDTIPNTIVQVLTNVVDYGMPLDQAVDAPRIHHGFVPDEVRYERRRPPPKQVLRALQKMGHTLSKKTLNIGDANDILLEDGVAWGYADPREGGLAVAPKAAKAP